MNVSELSGVLLDQWVARALGLRVELRKHSLVAAPLMLLVENEGKSVRGVPQYSADWALGGPIIEHSRIHVAPLSQHEILGELKGMWSAKIHVDGCPMIFGRTPLIAAMRAYVASKFRDEVTDMEGGA